MKKVGMMRVVSMIALLVMVPAIAVYAADGFSADFTSSGAGQAMRGKIAVSGGKSRMEMAGTTMIVRPDKNVSWMLMTGQGMYMEQPIDRKFIASASEKMSGELSREKIGAETVSGMATTKYLVTYEDAGVKTSVYQWIADGVMLPVKTAALDGSWAMTYENIKTGAQDPALFEIPGGYQKFAIPQFGDAVDMKAIGQMAADAMETGESD